MTTDTITRLIQAAEQAREAIQHMIDRTTPENKADTEYVWTPIAKDLTAAIEAAKEREAEPVAIGSEWTPCVKLPIVVHVREQRLGETHVSTREGITPIRPDDLIMRGVSGEEYPIGRELFNKTYTLDTVPQPQVPEWQPIETAPPDKTLLLAAEFDCPGDWRIKCGGYWNDQWNVWGASWTPTHWMPLPAAPKKEG